MRKKPVLIVITSLWMSLLTQTTYANTPDQSYRLWLQIGTQGNFQQDSKWLYFIEQHFRFFNPDNFYDQFVSRMALGYQLTPRVSLWQGYDFAPTYIAADNTIKTEQRSWQQLTWDLTKSTNAKISLRSRLEQRYFQGNSQWSMRLRERFYVSFPKALFNKYTPIIFDEIFFNLNNTPWTNNDFVNQNRVFIGIGIPVFKNSQLAVGYLNQWVLTNNNHRINHLLSLSLNIG
jgi:hypothetical protein